ncbi:MAG: GntR family transcriptional regulator [Gammaproteobacteria bacterium]
MSTRTEDVIARLRDLLIEGALAPESHLHEVALAQRLGVSRTPVRDALRVLANEGLLIYSPNRGYVVKPFRLQEILDAYDVRGTLEAMAARLCAEHGLDPGARAALTGIVERSEAIMAGGRWAGPEQDEWQRLNAAFHLAIVDATGNQPLMRSARQMRRLPRVYDPRLAPQSRVFHAIYTAERARRSHAEHREVLDAVDARQGARAESLMREHVYRNREQLRRSSALLEDATIQPLTA